MREGEVVPRGEAARAEQMPRRTVYSHPLLSSLTPAPTSEPRMQTEINSCNVHRAYQCTVDKNRAPDKVIG